MTIIKTTCSESDIESALISQLAAAGITASLATFGDVTKISYASPATGKQVFVRSTQICRGDDRVLNTLDYHDADFHLACR